MGSACQSRGPERRNGLCWPLRVGSAPGLAVLALALTLLLKWSRIRGGGAGGGSAPSLVGVVGGAV
jgi:hypothetical protein